jgi:bifunctional non-homologous end joining protein LigD
VIVPSENGVSDFSVLQNELRGKSNKLVLYAFDLLYLNGFDLRKAPLFERKALLRKLIAKTDTSSAKASKLTARRCSSRPARWASRA